MKTSASSARVRLDEEGFSVVAPSGQIRYSARWADIDEVIAYKRDLLTIDTICAAFSTRFGAIQITEESPGWDELMRALPIRLPGARTWDDAFHDIAVPAFATNRTTLFRRAG